MASNNTKFDQHNIEKNYNQLVGKLYLVNIYSLINYFEIQKGATTKAVGLIILKKSGDIKMFNLKQYLMFD